MHKVQYAVIMQWLHNIMAILVMFKEVKCKALAFGAALRSPLLFCADVR